MMELQIVLIEHRRSKRYTVVFCINPTAIEFRSLNVMHLSMLSQRGWGEVGQGVGILIKSIKIPHPGASRGGQKPFRSCYTQEESKRSQKRGKFNQMPSGYFPKQALSRPSPLSPLIKMATLGYHIRSKSLPWGHTSQ